MRHWRVAFAVLLQVAIVIAPTVVLADAEKHEWFGSWSMNHDGHAGTLDIHDIKADCASPAWCDMSLSYIDGNGTRLAGKILTIDDHSQHMRFQISFPGSNQTFDAYLFSWDKGKLAGTTRWGNRTFGFFATK